MKKIFTLLCLAISPAVTPLFAQGTWVSAAPTDGSGGNASVETGKAICTDAAGNVYMAGVFNSSTGATDFDLNAGTNTFVSSGNDGFIASYDKNGVFRWKTIISGTGNDFQIYFTGTATNGTDVWVAGSAAMAGAPQIISSTNTVTITSGTGLPASVDAMVAKLNCSNGAVQWVTTFGGSGNNDFATGLTIDPNGSCYTLGAYSGAYTLGSVSAPALVGSSSDEYVAKLTPGGTLRYLRCGGSAGVDMQGNGGGICYVPGATPAIIAVGSFNFSSATFGSQTVTNSGNANNNDMLLLELDTMLGVNNAIGMGTGTVNLGEELYGAVYDPFSGGVFVTGYINGGTVTVPGVGNLTSTGGEDIFIGRYSVAGNNFTWASLAGGASANDRGYSITADGQGGIILCGQTASAACMFGSINVAGEGNGANDIVVARYATNGTPIWALAAGGSGGDDARGISSYVQTVPYQQNLYITGNFQNTVTFGSTTLTADGVSNNDFFLARINDASLPLTATQSQVNLTCNGVCTGSATVVASGGVAPYTYSWSPSGGSGATASSLCAINYTCTITDATSTSITKTFTITQPPAIVITPISQTNVSCNGGSNGAAQVTASGGTGVLTYNWTPGNPTGDGTGSVTGLTAQVYTVTVTDANSCTATRTFNITQPPALVITPVSQTNVACFGGATGAASVSVSGGTPGYSYNWTPGNPPGDGSASVTGLTAQVYTVTVTDANACQGTRTFNITQPASALGGTTVVTNVACFGGATGAINLTPTGGTSPYTFNWLPSGPTTEDRTGLVAGTYSVQITDANSCQATVTATVTQPASPVSGTTVVTNVACFGGATGAINLTPSGGTSPYTFNWLPSGPTTEDRTGLVAGTYSVQITDANGCNGTVTATVTQPATPVSGTTVVTNVACFGGNTGAINLTPTGGTGPYTFNWLPSGPTTEDRTGLVAGTYSVQITDANGCNGTVTATVTQPASPVSGTTVVTNVACFGGNTGAINLTPTGGTGPYTFNWLPSGPTTEDRTGLVAGTYSVQITDVNGCNGTVTATVTQPASPVSGTTVVTNVACFGGNTGAINLTPTGGTGPYTFNWLPSGPTTEDRTGLVAGTYSVQITDANGCNGTVTATVTQPATPVSGTTVVTNVACFGGNTGAINLTPTGGTGPYTFNWLPSGPTTEDRTGLVAGTYSVQITDANGCNGTVTATVTQPASPVSGTTVVTNVACFGGNTGAINLTPTGGTGPYTFNWLPSGPTTEDRTGLVAGTYSVQITDANGCNGTVTATVTQPASPVSGTTVVTNVACFGGNTGAINLTPTGGTGPYTFNWLPSGPTTEDRTGLVAGTYSVQITDANGCNGTVTATVTQPASPVSGTTVVTNVTCFGGSTGAINLTPTGGTGPYTFNWLPSGPTTEDRTGLVAGTYSVQITDANGCNGTVTATVTQPASGVSGTTVVTNVACFGGSTGAINLTPTGGTGPYTFNWLPSGPTTEDRTGLVAGTYSVQITDANGCNGTVTATVTQPASAVSGTTVTTNVSCNGGSNGAINLTPTGGVGPYTFNWLPSGPTTEDRTGLTAGTYSVQITDANSCVTTVTVSVTQPPVLTASITTTVNVSCNGGTNGSATAVVGGGTPGYTYQWFPTGGTSATATGLTAGCYTLVGTDANGCTVSTTVCITQPTALVVSSTVTNVSCNGGSNGSVTVSVMGGTPAYTYSWTPIGGNTATASSLPVGSYTCTVTDANGCTITHSVALTEPSALTSASSHTDITCFGSNNGTASVSVSGGTSPYTYNWSPSGGTGATATGLGPAMYSCTITDANGCILTETFLINEPSAISSNPMQNNIICAGGGSGHLMVSPSGGTPTYTYSWSPVSSTANALNGIPAGFYTVIITDANGCTATQTFNLTEPPALTISTTQNNVSCFGGNDGSATVTVGGGVPGYTYTWAPTGGNSATATGLSAGCYTVTPTDANGCTITATVCITEPTPLSVTTGQTNVTCAGGADGDASVTVSGGTAPYDYSWSSGGTGSTESGLAAGTHTVTITDDNGCTFTQTFNITEPAAFSSSPLVTNVTCNAGSDGAVDMTITGGTSPYTYDWNSGTYTTEDLSGVMAGTYTLVLTDSVGCTFTETVQVTEPAAITANGTVTDASTCTSNDGAIDLAPAGGTVPYTFSWSNFATTEDISGLDGGSYSVTITDANGCTQSAVFTITEPGAPTVTYSEPIDSACGGSVPTPPFVLSGETPAGGTWSGPGVSGGTFDATTANIGYNLIVYTYTDSAGCSGSATDSIWVDLCMDVVQPIATGNVKVFPNPSTGVFTVQTESNAVITIYDALGNTVYSHTSTSTATQVDLAGFENGMYMITVRQNNELITTRVILTK